MRSELRDKIIEICDRKTATKGNSVGVFSGECR